MREIKFRAWQDDKMMYSDGCGVYDTKRFLDKLYEDCNLMQFTGLKDKNGKEIYEGDICRVDDGENLYEIIFYMGGFMGAVLPRKIRIYHISDSLLNNIEVIGNIHENPELIK